MNHHDNMIRRVFVTVCVLLSAAWSADAQSNLQREELCPYYNEIDPLIECIEVESYGGLAEVIESAPSGSEITFCPFFIRKISSLKPITVNTGVRVNCARTSPDQFCTIIGLGNHLLIDTAEDTLWQGFSFRGSNDHAVYISGDVANAQRATHTFCQTSFLENVRSKDTRGGALMIERSAGTVNVVESFFQENFSETFGAAIYSRASQLNIIYSLFIKNKCNGYGPAIFIAQGGNLMIKTTTFSGNNGRDGHDIVFNPGQSQGKGIYEDGFDNSINDGDCRGVYDLSIESCNAFENSPPTPFPTIRRTDNPTSKPTKQPTNPPTKLPTKLPTKPPTKPPTKSPIQVVTAKPTRPPIAAITNSPVQVVSTPPTNKNITRFPAPTSTQKPIASPTNVPDITKGPVQVVTKPTGFPGPNSTQKPVSSPTNEPTIAPIKIVASKPSGAPVPVTVKPTDQLTSNPTVTVKPPTMMPTHDFGKDIVDLCKFHAIPKERQCVDVKSFEDFKDTIESAIESQSKDVIFCGGFNLQKSEPEPVEVNRDIDIRCVERCSFFGVGPFARISGLSDIRVQNFEFVNSQDSSAVIISTFSAASKTTLCDTKFSRNQVSERYFYLGGALTIASGSGVVNVVNTTFTGNIASRGGAIHSEGFKLNVVGSKFVANNAYHSGNAIFLDNGNHLFVESSIFILNTEAASREIGHGGSTSYSAAIAVQPDRSIRDGSHNGNLDDGGSNAIILSGKCEGFFIMQKGFCYNFRQ